MQTLEQFLTKHPIRLDVQPAEVDAETAERWPNANHYRCTLTNDANGYTFDVEFHMGSALTNEPTVHDVLETLAMDAVSAEVVTSFEEWADELGMNSDSRRDERIYDEVCRQNGHLFSLLGFDAYEEILYQTERD